MGAMGWPSKSPMNAANSRVVLAHPSGNQFFRHLAAELRAANLLEALCTSIDWRGGVIEKILPAGVVQTLRRRNFSCELGGPVAQHPWREVCRLAAGQIGWTALTRHERGIFSVDAVYRNFDSWVARRLARVRGAGVAYAYEDAAEATLSAAGELGWKKVYDLPIAYWEVSRRLLEEEAVRWPEWEPTLVGTRDSAEKCERKSRELALADFVVCPSHFVAESLPETIRCSRRVIVAPFGSPPPAPIRDHRMTNRPLRVLFVGAMTQRKGLADIFAAIRLLNRRDVELVILGSPVVELGFYRSRGVNFVYEPPRSHHDVLALMQTCDVFCLPSIVEGRALVVQEALSQGLPALITANTGADDAVTDGANGFVVPIRSPETIAAKLAWLLENRAALPEFAQAARAAAARFTWNAYGAAIIDALAVGDGPGVSDCT
jgi:glycosyltransferase involved in cell wall biosynthesis